MKINRFEDLEIWNRSVGLAKELYPLTNNPKFKRDLGFCNQIRRAIISVSANIAEGFEKTNNTEFMRYLKIAKGSCGELRSHLYIAKEICYISDEEYQDFYKKILILSKQIGKFHNYLSHKRDLGEFKKK